MPKVEEIEAMSYIISYCLIYLWISLSSCYCFRLESIYIQLSYIVFFSLDTGFKIGFYGFIYDFVEGRPSFIIIIYYKVELHLPISEGGGLTR